MIVFPNCKINLGLSILSKRDDGYHNLETVFYPLPVTDALEIIISPADTKFSSTGLLINVGETDNICMKAYFLLKKDFPGLPSIQMHLHKTIPMGAGLGGGSADGAYTLLLLNRIFSLNLSTKQLITYASVLGSDCPFFIINKPCFGTGRGEIMEPISLDLSGYSFMLVNCGITINTGWAFSQLSLGASRVAGSLKDIVSKPVDNWKNSLANDFEKPVFQKYPEIKTIKDKLYTAGALYASMTGSGSTVFGIFKKKGLPFISFPGNYTIIELP